METVESSCVELWNKGRELHVAGKLLEAADVYTQVVLHRDVQPQLKGFAMNNLGLIMQILGHPERSAACFVYALQMHPECPEILNNFGNTRLILADYKGADAFFQAAIAKAPDGPDAHFNSASIALLLGDFKRGWREYDWRFKCPTFSTKPFPTKKPQWRGQSLTGKTIILTHEQGFGDTIMFCRYIEMIRSRYSVRIRFLGPPELECLIEPLVDEYLAANMDEDFDYHCPLLSLPRIFNTGMGKFPARVPYLKVDGNATLKGDYKVGLVWAGRPEHGRDKQRSMTFDQLAPLLDVPGVTWYSLQFGERAKGIESFPQVTDLRPIMKTWEDTARILNALNLLISVDTAVVHLAGALARPVWMLTPFSPDWRWMLEREDSPWYPTLRLFRQPEKEQWGPVIEKVRKMLSAEVVSRQCAPVQSASGPVFAEWTQPGNNCPPGGTTSAEK